LADPYGNKALNLLQYLRGLPLSSAGYYRAKQIAETEIARNYISNTFVPLKKGKRMSEGIPPFVEFDENFTDYELRYWERYGISAEELLQQQIYSLKSLRWGDSTNKVISTVGDPAFVYIFNRNPISWKVYRPLNTSGQKFRQWGIENVVEGMHQIHEAEMGILVSSTKERVVCIKACPEILFLNPTGEGSYIQLINNWSAIRPFAKQWFTFHIS